ncbi:MAG TPA: hypothetical protein VNC50_22060, partial [Planctomycetia bacterium]|nr:hypothetical protein [Planctomycetia bacterium]
INVAGLNSLSRPTGAPATRTIAKNGLVRNVSAAIEAVEASVGLPALVDPNSGAPLTYANYGLLQYNGTAGLPRVAADRYSATDGLGILGRAPNTAGTVSDDMALRYPPELLRGIRYDLNRPLTSYESNPQVADAERTAMAEQIYVILYLSAGLNLRPEPASAEELREAFAQARTLAQLAANIVDYIDGDNVMTRATFHPFLHIGDALVRAQWDLLDNPATPNCSFTVGSQALTAVQREEFTVVGFELPDLVISEGASITQDKNGTGLTYTFAELYNPWPNETDLDSGFVNTAAPASSRGAVPRGRLFDVALGTASNQSRFIIGVRHFNANVAINQYERPMGGGTYSPNYVYFNPGGTGTFSAPRNTTPVIPDIRGGQRLLVEPSPFTSTTTPADNDPTDWLQNWTAGTGSNRFAALNSVSPPNPTGGDDPNGALRTTRAMVPASQGDMLTNVSLYRVRCPYLPWEENTNPYVAIDTLELRGDNTTANSRGNYLVVGGTPAPAERKSLERKRPWTGSQRLWAPYRDIVTNPCVTLFNNTGAPSRFVEGKFLGFPYLTADATGAPPTVPLPYADWGNQLKFDGFSRCSDTVQGNTLYPVATITETDPGLACAQTDLATVDTQYAAKPDAAGSVPGRVVSFPFLNRGLATPLELLSVRLYGSYVWKVPGSAPGLTEREWRQRFTDDFEFIQANADTQAGAPNYPTLPGVGANAGFNRVYRSREVPWYLGDRGMHPIDETLPNDPAVAEPRYTPGDANATGLAPFPNLSRFFEFVECRSKINGAGGWTADPVIGVNALASTRERRIPGKININLVVDEEIFKSLFDMEEAMPWTRGNATPEYLRPARYPIDFCDPALPSGAQPVRAVGWNPEMDVSDLTISGAGAPYDPPGSFVLSNLPIEFGGGVSSDTRAIDLTGLSLTPNFLVGSPNRRIMHQQFPGIVNGYRGFTNVGTLQPTTPYTGWDRDCQVSSEFFRIFALSRNGRDAILGTSDDKPFRGYASDYLNETFLRRRNFAGLDLPKNGFFAGTQSAAIAGSGVNTPGEYITRLGGQWTPRLFDPVANPYFLDGNPGSAAAIAPVNTVTIARTADVAAPPQPGVDAPDVEYWMLEWRRLEALAKTAGNVTTRSNVFGVWLTVGHFRVQPGTETLGVPLLNEEVGSQTGSQIRHRGFFILDRSKATEYRFDQVGINPALQNHPIVTHFSIVE